MTTATRRIPESAANAGKLMDDAARLTPVGWDLGVTYGAHDSFGGGWTAGWYPTFRAHLSGDELLDATVVSSGETAAAAIVNLLARAGRLPR